MTFWGIFKITGEDWDRAKKGLALKEKTSETMTPEEILNEIDKVHRTVERIKQRGVTMWNYKEVLPQVFAVVETSFDIMKEVVKNLTIPKP